MKALLVEDDDLQRVIIEETLNKAYPNLELTILGSLKEAVEAVGQGQFQVILLDLGLPDSKGIDTLTALHARTPQTPIVVLTASEGGGLGTLCVQAGAQDFLQKQKLAPENLFQALEFAVHRKTGSVLLDIHRVISQLKTIAPSAPGTATEKFSAIYCRLLTEPRFLMTPEHRLLAKRLAEAGASSESVIALHAKCLAHVCREAKNIDRVRYIQNSSSVILATINYLATVYEEMARDEKGPLPKPSNKSKAASEKSEPPTEEKSEPPSEEAESPEEAETAEDSSEDEGQEKAKKRKGSTQEALARLRARRAAKKKKTRKLTKDREEVLEPLKKKKRKVNKTKASEDSSEGEGSATKKKSKNPSSDA